MIASKLILFFAIFGTSSAQLFGTSLNTQAGQQQGGTPENQDLLSGLTTGVQNGADSAAEWTQRIQQLVELVTVTLTEMGQAALEDKDNPEVGAQIVKILTEETAKATQILVEYTTSIPTSVVGGFGGRRRRAASMKDACDALKKAFDVFNQSYAKIEEHVKQLQEKAQKKIKKTHMDGVEKAKELLASCGIKE